jgi:hypothetical protein
MSNPTAIKRRLRNGLTHLPWLGTKLETVDRLAYLERFCPIEHFYSPVPAVAELKRDEGKLFDIDPDDLPGIDLAVKDQQRLIDEFARFHGEAPWRAEAVPGLRYRYDNTFYTYADALALYSMLRHLRPGRVIEVGSGWSSCVTLDTVEQFLGGLDRVRCTFIELDACRLRQQMLPGDRARIDLVEQDVRSIDITMFDELRANDVLFIDSSHVAKVGSDVNFLYFQVLPRLRPGVHVHVHDIFYPFEYPKEWVYGGRSWNEAYLVRALLTFNPEFRITWFGSYAERRFRPELARSLPMFLRSAAQNLWIRRQPAPEPVECRCGGNGTVLPQV